MRANTLRWIMVLVTFIVGIIIAIQLYWLNKTYSFEQKIFNTNVVKSLRGLYEDIPQLKNNPFISLDNNIEHPSPDYFLFSMDTFIAPASTSEYLKKEFEDFDVLTDAYLTSYDPQRNQYGEIIYLPTAAPRYTPTAPPVLRLYPKKQMYGLVYFPHRNKYILSQMRFWFISSGLLFLALISLGIILFQFYQQKFLAEIQKDFVNNFTHEFKTPLAVIKIASGVLLEESNLHKPEKLANYARIIEQQTDHLQMQVERLMTSATRLKTTPRLSFEPVSVNTLIQDSLKQIQPLLEHKKAKVDLLLDESNPQVNADASHLLIAFINLIENSLKYSGDPKIIISSGRTNGHVVVSIKDNGIGIEKKYLKKIFNRFFRIPTGNIHNVKGFGLGLNVVKTILHQHQAKIQVQSVYGIGTEFKILFPSI